MLLLWQNENRKDAQDIWNYSTAMRGRRPLMPYIAQKASGGSYEYSCSAITGRRFPRYNYDRAPWTLPIFSARRCCDEFAPIHIQSLAR